jgi:hypothetical protein
MTSVIGALPVLPEGMREPIPCPPNGFCDVATDRGGCAGSRLEALYGVERAPETMPAMGAGAVCQTAPGCPLPRVWAGVPGRHDEVNCTAAASGANQAGGPFGHREIGAIAHSLPAGIDIDAVAAGFTPDTQQQVRLGGGAERCQRVDGVGLKGFAQEEAEGRASALELAAGAQ